MDRKGKIGKTLRRWKLRYLLGGNNADAVHVSRAVDEIIEHARRNERAGMRRDRWLFGFEEEFEEISDQIAGLRDAGQEDAYREIYERLYAFAAETMADSYMPLYLIILYRCANAVLAAGEAEEALRLFEKLYEGTDRLISVNNPCGISCLERIAQAASQCGQYEKTDRALRQMAAIANEEFGPGSAMSLTVQRCAECLRGEEERVTDGIGKI